MRKIPTIFNRNWEGDRRVLDSFVEGIDIKFLKECVPTEKLDGTNVRLTVRQHAIVRIEKRRNPNKKQKNIGIVEPWYIDVDEESSENKWIVAATKNIDLAKIKDGEWSGEAIGPGIQGNYYKLNEGNIVLFSCGCAPVFMNIDDISFDGLSKYLNNQRSQISPEVLIEGIVFHHPDGRMAKIKRKDF